MIRGKCPLIPIPLIKKSMSPWKNLTICCGFISADRLCFQFLTRRRETKSFLFFFSFCFCGGGGGRNKWSRYWGEWQTDVAPLFQCQSVVSWSSFLESTLKVAEDFATLERINCHQVETSEVFYHKFSFCFIILLLYCYFKFEEKSCPYVFSTNITYRNISFF